MMIGAALFIGNLLLPDPIPFVDEILMLIATVAIGSVRSKKNPKSNNRRRHDSGDSFSGDSTPATLPTRTGSPISTPRRAISPALTSST